MSSRLCRGRRRVRFYDCEKCVVPSNLVVAHYEIRFAEAGARAGSSGKSSISRLTELSLPLSYGFSAKISIHVVRRAKSAAFGAQRALA